MGSSSSSRDHIGDIDPHWRNVHVVSFKSYSEELMFIVEKSDVGRKQIPQLRRQRNLCDRSIPSDFKEPGAEPRRMTKGCALLGCH